MLFESQTKTCDAVLAADTVLDHCAVVAGAAVFWVATVVAFFAAHCFVAELAGCCGESVDAICA
ncbi:hypothetical protein HOE67_04720 [Candidatus Peregrinibacteria bacterium]|nr:hypothetical protein [Candidatus Peregrinibacteria bacterium]